MSWRWAVAGGVVGFVVFLVLWVVDGARLSELPFVPAFALLLAGFAMVFRGRLTFGTYPEGGEGRQAASYMLPGALLMALGIGLYVLTR